MNLKDKKWIRIRIYIVSAGFFLIMCVIFLRTYQLQIIEGERLSALAKKGYTGRLTLTTRRGTIFDRSGRELALSIEVGSIYACPEKINDKLRAANLVSEALSVDRGEILRRLRSPRPFVWIKRKVTPEEIRSVRELDIEGVEITKENRRYYPSMETCAHVVGFASQDNKGLEGIELKYDTYLKGRKASFKKIRDALGRSVFFGRAEKERQGPFDLVLTLDKEISYKAQKMLRKAVKNTGSKSGVCIVTKPRTGEILAMSVVPEFNPNIFWRFEPYQWRNRAVTDCFEPGSTLKAFLLASALEEEAVDPETVIDCEDGRYEVGDFVIHDSRAFGKLKARNIIKYSSNIGAIKIGQRLGAERFHQYMKKFGFGEVSGVDFPGERKGTLRSVESLSRIGKNTLYFGHGISVSLLQLAMAFGAVANDGFLMRPYLVKSILDKSGRCIREFNPQVRNRVISAETAKTARRILEGVVKKGGTATRAAIEGYLVAGKTGTAQKVDPVRKTYSKEKFVAIFGGFVPSDSPEVVILVALDEPKGKPYGGVVAAPVFREVGGWVLNHMNIRPSVELESPLPPEPKRKIKPVSIDPISEDAVPDFRGLSIREVLRRAEGLGVGISIQGTGLAAEQSPEPGTELEKDIKLKVKFKPVG